jgi:hypothetical protein
MTDEKQDEGRYDAVGRTLPTHSDARKYVPLLRGVLRYFPAALAGVARVSCAGNAKHNPELHAAGELRHSRGKSSDHADCIVRHLIDLGDDAYDENGVPQVDYIAWRALALAQEWHEAHGAPVAPAAVGATGRPAPPYDGEL